MPFTLTQYREKYPEYANIPDAQLAVGIKNKYAPDEDADIFLNKLDATNVREDFLRRIGDSRPGWSPDERSKLAEEATMDKMSQMNAFPLTSVDPKFRNIVKSQVEEQNAEQFMKDKETLSSLEKQYPIESNLDEFKKRKQRVEAFQNSDPEAYWKVAKDTLPLDVLTRDYKYLYEQKLLNDAETRIMSVKENERAAILSEETGKYGTLINSMAKGYNSVGFLMAKAGLFGDEEQQHAGAIYNGVNKAAELNAYEDSFIGRQLAVAGNTLPSMGMTVLGAGVSAVGAGTGSPLLVGAGAVVSGFGKAMMATDTFYDVKNSLIEQGVEESKANLSAGAASALVVALESAGGSGTKYITKTPLGRSLIKKVGQGIVRGGKEYLEVGIRETFEELSQEAVQRYFANTIPKNQDGSLDWTSITDIAKDIAVSTMILSIGLKGTTDIVGGALSYDAMSRQRKQLKDMFPLASEIQLNKGMESIQRGDNYSQMVDNIFSENVIAIPEGTDATTSEQIKVINETNQKNVAGIKLGLLSSAVQKLKNDREKNPLYAGLTEEQKAQKTNAFVENLPETNKTIIPETADSIQSGVKINFPENLSQISLKADTIQFANLSGLSKEDHLAILNLSDNARSLLYGLGMGLQGKSLWSILPNSRKSQSGTDLEFASAIKQLEDYGYIIPRQFYETSDFAEKTRRSDTLVGFKKFTLTPIGEELSDRLFSSDSMYSKDDPRWHNRKAIRNFNEELNNISNVQPQQFFDLLFSHKLMNVDEYNLMSKISNTQLMKNYFENSRVAIASQSIEGNSLYNGYVAPIFGQSSVIQLFGGFSVLTTSHEFGHLGMMKFLDQKAFKQLIDLYYESDSYKEFIKSHDNNYEYGKYRYSFEEWYAREFSDYVLDLTTKGVKNPNGLLQSILKQNIESIGDLWRLYKREGNLDPTKLKLYNFFDNLFTNEPKLVDPYTEVAVHQATKFLNLNAQHWDLPQQHQVVDSYFGKQNKNRLMDSVSGSPSIPVTMEKEILDQISLLVPMTKNIKSAVKSILKYPNSGMVEVGGVVLSYDNNVFKIETTEVKNKRTFSYWHNAEGDLVTKDKDGNTIVYRPDNLLYADSPSKKPSLKELIGDQEGPPQTSYLNRLKQAESSEDSPATRMQRQMLIAAEFETEQNVMYEMNKPEWVNKLSKEDQMYHKMAAGTIANPENADDIKIQMYEYLVKLKQKADVLGTSRPPVIPSIPNGLNDQTIKMESGENNTIVNDPRNSAVPTQDDIDRAVAAVTKKTIATDQQRTRARRILLRDNHKLQNDLGLTPDESILVKKELTGKASMSEFTDEELATYHEELKNLKSILSDPRFVANNLSNQLGLKSDDTSRMLNASSGDYSVVATVLKNRLDSGGYSDNKEIRTRQIQRDVSQNGSIGGRKRLDASLNDEQKGKRNLVSTFWSMRYVFDTLEQLTGLPFFKTYEMVENKGIKAEYRAFKSMLDVLKKPGTRTGKPLTRKLIASEAVQSPHINMALFESDETKRNEHLSKLTPIQLDLYDKMREILQGVAADEIREIRWWRWNRAVTEASLTQSKDRRKVLNKEANRLKPKDISKEDEKRILDEGRTAYANGRLSEWIKTQKFGTREQYFMSQTDNRGIRDSVLSPVEFDSELGGTQNITEQFMRATNTREGDKAEVIHTPVLQAVMYHLRRASITNAIKDDYTKLNAIIRAGELTSSDTTRIQEWIDNLLGRPENADWMVSLSEKVNNLFWRSFALQLSRAGHYVGRNMLQFLGVQGHIGKAELLRSTSLMVAGRVNPFLKDEINKRWYGITQKKALQEEFMFLGEASKNRNYGLQSQIGSKMSQIADLGTAVLAESDEATRKPAFMIFHEAAYHNGKDFIEGKRSLDSLRSNLYLDNLAQSQVELLDKNLQDKDLKEFCYNYAKYKVENIFMKYNRTSRSMSEQSRSGRVLLGLITYPRGMVEQLVQNSLKPAVRSWKAGDVRGVYQGVMTLVGTYVAVRMTNELGKAIMGEREREDYTIAETFLGYTPASIGYKKIMDIFDTISNSSGQIISEDGYSKKSVSRIVAELAGDTLDWWIPFADMNVSLYENINDKAGMNFWSVVSEELGIEYQRKRGRKYNYDRTLVEGMQRTIFGSEKFESRKKEFDNLSDSEKFLRITTGVSPSYKRAE